MHPFCHVDFVFHVPCAFMCKHLADKHAAYAMDICTMLVAASAAQIIVAAALFVAHSISKEEHPEIISVFLNSNMHHYRSDSP